MCDVLIEMDLTNITYDVGWIQLAEGKVQCLEFFHHGDEFVSSMNQEISLQF